MPLHLLNCAQMYKNIARFLPLLPVSLISFTHSLTCCFVNWQLSGDLVKFLNHCLFLLLMPSGICHIRLHKNGRNISLSSLKIYPKCIILYLLLLFFLYFFLPQLWIHSYFFLPAMATDSANFPVLLFNLCLVAFVFWCPYNSEILYFGWFHFCNFCHWSLWRMYCFLLYNSTGNKKV